MSSFNNSHQTQQLPTFIGPQPAAGSLSITIASDQGAIPVSGIVATTNASTGPTGAPVPAQTTAVGAKDPSGNLQDLLLTASGGLQIDATSLPLPTGASTAAGQATLSAQFPATLGAKASAASLGVVLASDQAAIATAATQSGTWNLANITGVVSLPTGAATAANQATANTSLATIATNTTGAATAANQTTANASLSSIDSKTPTVGQKAMAASQPVTLASDQSAVPVSGTVASTQSGTWNVTNITGTVSLPTGAATAANQTTANTSLASITGQLPATIGTKASAASLAVVLASDQAAIPATQSGTWNLTNISGTVSLPTGASTSALQTTANSSLSSIATNTANIPAKGAAATSGSTPVNIASDQVVPVSATALPLPTGASTSALQTTANSSLSTVATNTGNIPAKGAATTANSTPVNIASDQTVPVSGSVTATSAAATAVFQAEGSLASGSLLATFVTVFTAATNLKVLTLRNSCNTSVKVSFDGGTTAAYVLEQGDAIIIDLRADNLQIASGTAVSAAYETAAATSGKVRVNGLS